MKSAKPGTMEVTLKQENGTHRIAKKKYKKEFRCVLCQVNFASKHSVKVHILNRSCLKYKDKYPRTCEQCKRCFDNRKKFNNHKRYCGKSSKLAHTRCIMQGCELVFYKRMDMLAHIEADHNIEIAKKKLTFPNMVEFHHWKEKVELETLSFFSLTCGSTKVNDRGKCYRYFTCQFDAKNTKQNTHKSKERDQLPHLNCPARMLSVEKHDGSVDVTYVAYHNHELHVDNLKFQPVPLSLRQQILDKIAQQVPATQILAEIRQSCNTISKWDTISLKYIRNLISLQAKRSGTSGSSKHVDSAPPAPQSPSVKKKNSESAQKSKRTAKEIAVSHTEATSAVQNSSFSFNGHEEIVINWHEDVHEEFVEQDDVSSTLITECLSYLENITTVVRDTSMAPDLFSHIHTTLRDLDTYCNTHLAPIPEFVLPKPTHTSFAEFMSQIPEFNAVPQHTSNLVSSIPDTEDCRDKSDEQKPKRKRRRKNSVTVIVKPMAPHIKQMNANNPLLSRCKPKSERVMIALGSDTAFTPSIKPTTDLTAHITTAGCTMIDLKSLDPFCSRQEARIISAQSPHFQVGHVTDNVIDAYLATLKSHLTGVKVMKCAQVKRVLLQGDTTLLHKQLKRGECNLVLLPLNTAQRSALAIYKVFKNSLRFLETAPDVDHNTQQEDHVIAAFLADIWECDAPKIEYLKCCKRNDDMSGAIFVCHLAKLALQCKTFIQTFNVLELRRKIYRLLFPAVV